MKDIDETPPMRGSGDSLDAAKKAREMYPHITRGLHCADIAWEDGYTVVGFAAVDGVVSRGRRKGFPKWGKVTARLTVPDKAKATP